MIITAEEFRDAYNEIFFKGEDAQDAMVSIFIMKGEEKLLMFPDVTVNANHTIGEIARAYHHFLKENPIPTPSVEKENEPPKEKEAKVVDINDIAPIIVEYRENTYSVKKMGELYDIENQKNGKKIKPTSPMGRGIIKKLG